MQGRRCLYSQLLIALITLLSMLVSPRPGGAQAVPSVTEQDITGLVIATQEDRVSVSEGDTVILDQGRLQGVEAGDHYAVFQDGRTSVHPFTGRLIPVPREVIGELVVVRVYDRTATAQILRSRREVNVGAPIAPLRPALARQTESRPEGTGVAMQTQARLAQLSTCLETTRQALQTAEGAGVKAADLADARGARASAEVAVEQAHALLAAGEAERASESFGQCPGRLPAGRRAVAAERCGHGTPRAGSTAGTLCGAAWGYAVGYFGTRADLPESFHVALDLQGQQSANSRS